MKPNIVSFDVKMFDTGLGSQEIQAAIAKIVTKAIKDFYGKNVRVNEGRPPLADLSTHTLHNMESLVEVEVRMAGTIPAKNALRDKIMEMLGSVQDSVMVHVS